MRPIFLAIPVTFLALSACREEAAAPLQPERISLEDARHIAENPLASPNVDGATWSVSPNGQAIHYAKTGEAPFLTLECNLRATPPQLHVIRHVTARPGEKALFPVIGNGMISRFKLDATLADGEWRWEGAEPAADPQLDVFTGARELEATLPGGGTLAIAGSRIPGEFVRWCRAGGRVQQAEAAEQKPEG
ncbi:conserved hypothetical protein [Altererythrobacter sp. B11]|uniref:hypothetical protein n=1 Tax=Altererythrobacter sp. B11 TaxID=2060312 RepID=UPI000DC73984|nr:hypothetical protein [Altererythrobacter sp. B11]BBC72238.1 conserved hypothetical protein [Altererythrobacter sp. B11]